MRLKDWIDSNPLLQELLELIRGDRARSLVTADRDGECIPVRWRQLPAFVLAEARVRVDGRGLVYVPYFNGDGSLFNRRVFAPGGQMWWETAGTGLIPYGVETLADDATRMALVVCEGETDALACRAAFVGAGDDGLIAGYDVLAIPGARTWRPEWRLILEPYAVIYLLGDGDQAGQDMNRAIAADVPWARAVRLPAGEDVRSLLQRDGTDALDPYLDEADWLARVSAGFRVARTLSELEALLRGEEIRDAT